MVQPMVTVPGKKKCKGKKFKRIGLIYVHMPSKLNAEIRWQLQAIIQVKRSLHVRRGGHRMSTHTSNNSGEADDGQEKVEKGL
jgi:hypothetical protein